MASHNTLSSDSSLVFYIEKEYRDKEKDSAMVLWTEGMT